MAFSFPITFYKREGIIMGVNTPNDLKSVNFTYTKDDVMKCFEHVPIDANHYVNGQHSIHFAATSNKDSYTPERAELWPAHRIHSKLVENTIERVIKPAKTSHEEKVSAQKLIDNIIAHHRVAILNWVYHLEHLGWGEQYYKDWLAPAPYLTPQDELNRVAVAKQGQDIRQKWVSVATEFASKLIGALKDAADEARPFYRQWVEAEGMVLGEQHNPVKLSGVKFQPGYSRLADYNEQSPSVKADLDAWVGKNYPGSDAEGINNLPNSSVNDYTTWVQKVFVKLLKEHLVKAGAPEVVEGAYEFGVNPHNTHSNLSKAVPYWGKPAGKIDLWENEIFNVIGAYNPVFRGGPSIRPVGVDSELLCVFANRSFFFVPKINFAKVAPDSNIEEFPNKGDWRRPAGYAPPAPKAEPAPPPKPSLEFKGDVPKDAELFLDWSDNFTSVSALEFAFKSRLSVLESWRDKVKAKVEEEEKQKGGWEPFNDTPKDAMEAVAIYQKRMDEWKQKTGGTDMPKMNEILAWFQGTMARLSAPK